MKYGQNSSTTYTAIWSLHYGSGNRHVGNILAILTTNTFVILAYLYQINIKALEYREAVVRPNVKRDIINSGKIHVYVKSLIFKIYIKETDIINRIFSEQSLCIFYGIRAQH